MVLRTAEPLTIGAYADHRSTGSFVLIAPAGGTTSLRQWQAGNTPLRR
ncbi:hypothetical protein ACIQU4_36105 [Streptomyces sp. NPDC090741]